MDTKSAGILGICLIIAALIVAFPHTLASSQSEVGRYQFGRSNGVNCFVLDTKTGRLWQGFIASNSNEAPTWQENKTPWLAEATGK